MKKKIRLAFGIILFLVTSTQVYAANTTNKAWVVESFFIKYTGTIQFKPNYKVEKNAGYGLKTGKYVSVGYINFVRNNISLTRGRVYTKKRNSGNTIEKLVVVCYDSLFWGDKNTTHFFYGWIYR